MANQSVPDFVLFGDSINDIAKSLQDSLSKISGSFDYYRSFNKQIGEIITESLGRLPNSVKQFAVTGWYPTKEMTFSEIHHMAELVDQKRIEEVDDYMTDHIQEIKDRIFKGLLDRFPERKNILLSGINAHERADYYASIPIFLSQSDGLCYQITGYKLYTTEKKKPKVAKYHQKLKDGTLDHILLQPLTITSTLISQNETGYPKYSLNRHLVLHGLSLDYGTFSNSCKAISALNFVGEILWASNKDEKINAT